MVKILVSLIIITSSIVYIGDTSKLKYINYIFIDETQDIVKKCVLANENYQPYFNVNLLNKNIDKYIEENFCEYKKLNYNIEYDKNEFPCEVSISIFFKINLITNFNKSVSYKIVTNGRYINE